MEVVSKAIDPKMTKWKVDLNLFYWCITHLEFVVYFICLTHVIVGLA